MAFKEVNDLQCETTIALGGANKKTGKANPTSIEGYYLGNTQIPDKKKQSGVSYIHAFQTAEGNIGVWGKTDLDKKMLAVTVGSMCRASHTGFRPTPNGDMYTYKVEVDEANTIEVITAKFQATDGASNEAEEDATEPADEVPYTRPRPPGAPARAPNPNKVGALLSSRK